MPPSSFSWRRRGRGVATPRGDWAGCWFPSVDTDIDAIDFINTLWPAPAKPQILGPGLSPALLDNRFPLPYPSGARRPVTGAAWRRDIESRRPLEMPTCLGEAKSFWVYNKAVLPVLIPPS